MNRGLILGLLLLAFVVTLVSADALLLSEVIEESETALAVLDPVTPPTFEKVVALCTAYERHRFFFSISVPLGLLNEYEEALASLSAGVQAGEAGAYATARTQAMTALSQIKRSALFSPEQIF